MSVDKSNVAHIPLYTCPDPIFGFVCFSHVNNTAGGSLHRRVHNSNKSSTLFMREGVQQAEAGSNVVTHDILDNTQTLMSALMATNSLNMFVCVLYVDRAKTKQRVPSVSWIWFIHG